MTKIRRGIVELLDTLAFAAIFYAIFATAWYLVMYEPMSFAQIFYFAALIAVNFCMRRICFTNWLPRKKRDASTVVTRVGLKLAVTHLIIQVVLIFILPSTVMGETWFAISLSMGLSVVVSWHSVWFALRKTTPGRKSIIFTTAAIFITLAFWMASRGSWFFLSIYTPLMLFVAVARLIVVHMVRVDDSLEAVKSSNQPLIGKIIAFNYKLLVGFALVFSGTVAAIYFTLMRPTLVAVGNAFERLPSFERDELAAIITMEEYLGASVFGGQTEWGWIYLLHLLYDMRPSTNNILNVILTIIFGVGILIVFAMLAYAILRGIFYWLNQRAIKAANMRGPLTDLEDEKEFIGMGKKHVGKHSNKERNEHPTRRLFKKTVRKYVKMGVPIKNTDTPTEMTVRVHNREFDSLANEYSQVRYGKN